MENEIGIIELVIIRFLHIFFRQERNHDLRSMYKTKTKEKKKKIYLKFDCQIFGRTISRIH